MMGATRIRTNRAGRGFTLVELLVVVLILAILMAVALPLYLNAIADSSKKTCQANMQTIANAVQAARVAGRLSDYSTFTGAVDTTKVKDLGYVPQCPDIGAYTISTADATVAGGFVVHCSKHGSFEPGAGTKDP